MSKHPIVFLLLYFFASSAQAQQQRDSILTDASLEECIQYALNHQPGIKQSLLDERIVNANVKSRLADWYPQINFDYTLQHYFKTPVTVINGTPVSTAAENFSTAYFSVNQNIFDRDVLLASRTARDVRTTASQLTTNNKINLTLNVSKAFYALLLAQKQIDLVDQDIIRLTRSVSDAYNQYKAGVVDKTDYKRAQILLNNAQADRKQYEEAVNARFATLKLFMGYPQDSSFNLEYDSAKLRNEISLDTLQQVNYTNRIEYQILQTEESLLQSNLKYYKWGFIPSVSAYGNYNLFFANNDFGKLYSREFPTSFVGLAVSFPIFQGFKRGAQIRSAQLSLDRLQYNFQSLRDSILTEYTQAVSVYKAALSFFKVQEENLELAKDVYNITDLQYKSGVKTYLEVIVAESNLRTTQVNYLNALYALLSSKLDAEKALGTLTY